MARVITLVLLQYHTQFNKLTSVFYASVLLLMINCAIKVSKVAVEPARAATANFDNVMTKFIFNNRTDAYKTDANLSFTITRPETGQIPGINEVFERQVCRVQEAHLHKAARASPSVDDKLKTLTML